MFRIDFFLFVTTILFFLYFLHCYITNEILCLHLNLISNELVIFPFLQKQTNIQFVNAQNYMLNILLINETDISIQI